MSSTGPRSSRDWPGEFDVAHADLAAEVGGLIASLVESRLITELGDG